MPTIILYKIDTINSLILFNYTGFLNTYLRKFYSIVFEPGEPSDKYNLWCVHVGRIIVYKTDPNRFSYTVVMKNCLYRAPFYCRFFRKQDRRFIRTSTRLPYLPKETVTHQITDNRVIKSRMAYIMAVCITIQKHI